jgi:hypothetical protein
MVKFFNQRKNQKKKPNKKPKFIKKKFKRIISNERRSHYCLNISIVNWASIFLQEFSFPKEGNFHKKFFEILKKLKFNENEFVEWILYLEHYIKETKNNDLESFYYLGLLLKESLGTNLRRNNDDIDEEKMAQVKLIFEKKKINVKEFNKKFNYFSQYNQQSENYNYDINSIIDYICSSDSRINKEKKAKNAKKATKNRKVNKVKKGIANKQTTQDIQNIINNQVIPNNQPIPENQAIQNNKGNHNGNEANHFIDNENIRFDPINNKPNNDFGESYISNPRIYGIDRYDDESLPNGDSFQKLDSSCENLERAIFMNNKKEINK